MRWVWRWGLSCCDGGLAAFEMAGCDGFKSVGDADAAVVAFSPA
jgi:hypothetical protein